MYTEQFKAIFQGYDINYLPLSHSLCIIKVNALNNDYQQCRQNIADMTVVKMLWINWPT